MLRHLFISGSFLLIFTSIEAQGVNVKIIEGFKKGDIALLQPFLASQIELTTPHKEGTFEKAVIEKKLTEFFRAYPTLGFTIKHSGKSPSGGKYSIGILQTNRGTFRVYLLFGSDKESEIHAIRIESDE